jgi:hypothetical protein
VLTAAAWLCATPAGSSPPGVPPGAAVTRSVAQYQALEAGLADLAVRRDRAGLEALIDGDFAAYVPGGADPSDRAAFVAAELAHPVAVVIYALDVLERGDLDLVSFLARPQGVHGSAGAAYIVDVWRRADHRLVARYRSQPRRAPAPPTGPTGRG